MLKGFISFLSLSRVRFTNSEQMLCVCDNKRVITLPHFPKVTQKSILPAGFIKAHGEECERESDVAISMQTNGACNVVEIPSISNQKKILKRERRQEKVRSYLLSSRVDDLASSTSVSNYAPSILLPTPCLIYLHLPIF